MAGYQRAPLTACETQRKWLYSLHLALIMVIETVFRGHVDPTAEHWARERLDEVMRHFAALES